MSNNNRNKSIKQRTIILLFTAKVNDVYSFAERPPGIEKAREDGPG